MLDASSTRDPDHASSYLTVEWDLDGDGIFDTAPTTRKTYTASFPTVGVQLITVRVTDPAGAQSVSTPLALRIDVGAGPVPFRPVLPSVFHHDSLRGGIPHDDIRGW